MTPLERTFKRENPKVRGEYDESHDGVRAPLDPFDKSARCGYYRSMIPKKSNGGNDLLSFPEYFARLISSNVI